MRDFEDIEDEIAIDAVDRYGFYHSTIARKILESWEIEIRDKVLSELNEEWGNTFNDYQSYENATIYTAPTREIAESREDDALVLVTVRRWTTPWETIDKENE